MPQRDKSFYHESAMLHAIYSQPWVLCPTKCFEIQQFLDSRADGTRPTEDELRTQFGLRAAARSDDDDHPIIDGVQVIDCLDLLAPKMDLMMRYSGGTSTQKMAQQIAAADRNDAVTTILMRIDSPGGAATGIQEVAEALERAAANGTRTVAHATSQCASGAFWIAAACQHFVASPSTAIGSHGAYWIHRSDAAKNQTAGQAYTVVRAGINKAIGNPYEDLTPETHAVMQERVDALMTVFTESLARGRGVSVDVVLSQFGQGKTFLAAEALQRGMIDAIGTFDDTLAAERERRLPSRRSQTVSAEETLSELSKMNVTQRIRAALYARGLIATLDGDSDDFCRGLITSMGVTGDESQIVARITAQCPTELVAAIEATAAPLQGLQAGQFQSSVPVAQTSVTPLPPQPPVQQQITEHDVTLARQEGIQAEQFRQDTIRAKGELLGAKAEDIRHAIETNLPVADAANYFTERMAETTPAINSGINIEAGPAAIDKFCDAASEMVIASAGGVLARTSDMTPIKQYGNSFQYKRPIDLCRMELELRNVPVTGDGESDALAWLQMLGSGTQILAADGGSVNTPGAHPDMLSSLVSKVFNRAYPISSVKFQSWCSKMEDLPDLKPRAIIETGIFNELDLLDDDEEPKEKKFDSQLASWMQADRYGNKVGLTPVMVANDDMGGFARQLASLSGGGPRTLNRLCLDLLAGNVLMIDGTPLFHADHNNLIDTGSGGVPSAAQASSMRLTHRNQTHISDEGSQIKIDEPPSLSLHPAAHEQEAKQVFMTNMYDPKVAQTDATINTVRNEIDPIITGRLDEYSTLEWYTFVNPDVIHTIAYAYQRGWGAGGRRTTWFEPGSGTRYYKLEARFAAAAIGWRGAVKNAGA